jgi:hypothetical protein
MRGRVTLALLALSLPVAEMSAQRATVPPRTTRGPRPAEKPPQAPGIPDARMYSRYRLSRFSYEQYPMLTYLQTTGMIAAGIPSTHTMFGDGTHMGFRVAPSFSATADLTSAMIGAPVSLGSFDFGFRATPWASRRFRPFADARTSWAYAVPASGVSNVVPLVLATRTMFGDITTGKGRGTLLGLGVETTVRRNLLLSSSLSSTHYAMTGRQLGGSWNEWKYTADALRLAVGLLYNPGRGLEGPR